MSEFEKQDRNQTIDIGENLRKLRETRNLSIRSLSNSSGLAVNTLSLIENGKTSPSVNTLTKLAKAIGIPITAFFESDSARSDVGFTKISTASTDNFRYGKFLDLGSQKTSHHVGPFLIKLYPKSYPDNDLITHSGYEFVFCLQGRFEYLIKDKSYQLESGDSLLFDSSLPHIWRNTSDLPVQFLLVLYPIISSNNLILNHIFDFE